MKTYERMKYQGRIAVAAACLALGWVCWNGGSAARAQTPPANLSPSLQDVVKLTQTQMGDDVIITFIKNSGQSYNLSADDILYLHSQGVSQAVISTLLQSRGVASTPAAPPPAIPAPESPPPAAPVSPPRRQRRCMCLPLRRRPGLALALTTFTRNWRLTGAGWICRLTARSGGPSRRCNRAGVLISTVAIGNTPNRGGFGSRNIPMGT